MYGRHDFLAKKEEKEKIRSYLRVRQTLDCFPTFDFFRPSPPKHKDQNTVEKRL
jgi:hypothetical protein